MEKEPTKTYVMIIKMAAFFIIPIVGLVFLLNSFSSRPVEEQLGTALRVLTPVQGGTGFGTVTAGNIGNCLKVLSDTPFAFELGTCGGGGGTDSLFNWITATNIISTDGASTTATTSLSTNGFTANAATTTALVVPTSINLFSGGAKTSANDLCIQLTGSADLCDGSDATGGGGGSISTSSVPVAGNLAYWTSNSALSDIATGTLSESVAGLEFSASRGLVGGSAALSLSSGYTIPLTASTSNWDIAFASTTAMTPTYTRGLFSNTVTGLTYTGATGITSLTAGYGIPLTASTTNWNTFYDTPSNRITDGNGLTWSGNTLNFDGGNSPAGALGGTWASPTVDDDGHNHTGTTISGLDISSDTNLSADGTEIILTGDALSLGTELTFNSATTSNLAVSNSLNLFGSGSKTTNNALCIQLTGSADLCDGTDATGGSGVLSTSSPWTSGELAYVLNGSTISSVATGTLTESVSGLELNATRGLVGGSAILALTSGFTIPTTTDTTNWNTFYTTPSNRITAGTNLSWSSNTLNAATQISTSSSNGNLAFWTGTSALGNVATGTLTETVTGLEFDQTRALVGGSAILALTSGYAIPLSASTTNWETFYTTPSNRITAGTGIDWTGNTLNGVYTAGDALTLTGEDFDFDGGTVPAGALGGTWASPTVDDDGHNHTGTTLSGIDISADTNLSADGTEIVLTGDALSMGTALTFLAGTSTNSFFSGLGTFTNLVVSTLATFLNVTITGLLDLGAGVLEIPNGSAPTVDSIGEIAFDSTDNQLVIATSSTVLAIPTITRLWSATIASSSLDFASGGRMPIPPHRDGVVITEVHCFVDGGTSKVINLDTQAGGAQLDSLTCATTLTSDTAQSANNSLSAGALMALEFGATTGSVDYVTFSAWGYVTRE